MKRSSNWNVFMNIEKHGSHFQYIFRMPNFSTNQVRWVKKYRASNSIFVIFQSTFTQISYILNIHFTRLILASANSRRIIFLPQHSEIFHSDIQILLYDVSEIPRFPRDNHGRRASVVIVNRTLLCIYCRVFSSYRNYRPLLQHTQSHKKASNRPL